MDVFRFINSKDIRAYLQEQQYTFNSLETAWLIYQCRTATLAEKHDAWNDLIQTMPDCEMPKQIDCIYHNSLHSFLTEYMSFQNKHIANFYRSESNAIFCGKLLYEQLNDWCEIDAVFSTYQHCFEGLRLVYEFAEKYEIKKQYTDNSNECITAEVTPNGELMAIDIDSIEYEEQDDLYYEVFFRMHFNFPTPFKPGDIIWNPFLTNEYNPGPCVMIEIASPFAMSRKNPVMQDLDNEDMYIYGIFVNHNYGIYQEYGSNYMNYEYYTNPLIDLQKIYPTLQLYLRGKCNLTLLLQTYHYYLMQYYLKDYMIDKSGVDSYRKKGYFELLCASNGTSRKV